jgi:hypothetical protein
MISEDYGPTVPAHLVGLVTELHRKPIESPPAPWRKAPGFAIGALTAVGYAPDSDLLLVVSSQGRGVFDCIRGEKIARDYENSSDFIDETKLLALGIGPLDGQWIRVSGLHGGGLPNSTKDGWGLEALPLPWPNYHIFLTSPWKSIYDGPENIVKVETNGACELRAYGFSETGRSFVVALSCEITIFARDAG